MTLDRCCGLDFLETTKSQDPIPENWLEIETELRKLSSLLSKQDKIASVFAKKKLSRLIKTIVWPEEFLILLRKLLTILLSDQLPSKDLIDEMMEKIKVHYFQSLPLPGYWEYEDLIRRLDNTLDVLREKNWKDTFQKSLKFLDDYHWPQEIRHQIEDVLELSHFTDIYQKIKNIMKKLKAIQPLPSF